MNIKKIIFTLSFFLLISCGYESIYSDKNKKNYFFSIDEIEFAENTRLNRKIKNKLKPYMGLKDRTKNIKLKIKSYKNKTIESKNVKGEAEKFKVEIIVNVSIAEKENYNKNINIKESFIYDNQTNQYNLTEYETQIDDNLISKITNKIVTYLYSLK